MKFYKKSKYEVKTHSFISIKISDLNNMEFQNSKMKKPQLVVGHFVEYRKLCPFEIQFPGKTNLPMSSAAYRKFLPSLYLD